MSKDKEEIWERQPGESTQAFEAFRTYRDLGLKRSNKAVSDTLSKSRQLISRWKATWNWDERVRAYDTALEREAHKEAVKNLKDMTSRHIKIEIHVGQCPCSRFNKPAAHGRACRVHIQS